MDTGSVKRLARFLRAPLRFWGARGGQDAQAQAASPAE